MSNIRTKLFGLATVATAFAGMSYGQTVACAGFGTANTPNPTLRAEGQTELVADTTATGCTTTANYGGAPTATTGSVIATLSLPVTSKAETAANATGSGTNVGNSEAVLTLTAPGPVVTTYYGTVTGNQVSFNNVAFPAAFTLLASNIRVNASGGGAPQVTETLLLSYTTTVAAGAPPTTANAAGAAQNVGYILQTLGATTLGAGVAINGFAATNSYTVCTGNVIGAALGALNTSFTVLVKELVGGAFKTAGAALAGGEGGTFIPAGANAGGVGLANTATQVTVALANIPSAATVYVPQTVTVTGTTLTIAGSTAATTGATAGLVAYTPSAGAVTITYTVSAVPAVAAGATTFGIPVIVGFAANAAPVQTAMTAQVYYTPTGTVTGPAATIPTFAASTLAAAPGSVITACVTNLLFPFLTNQLGFDTGIVIANTTTDSLGTAKVPSSVAAQSGTCTLSFFGAGAPTPSVAVADPLGSTASGTTHAFVVSSIAPGFQGYAIATCPFLYAHGFAYIAYNLTQNNGTSMGYLAEVLTPARPAVGTGSEAVTF